MMQANMQGALPACAWKHVLCRRPAQAASLHPARKNACHSRAHVMQEERSQGQKGQPADPNASGGPGSSYEENEQELLCVCQQPYNVDTAMISCDVCEDWYHLRCVGMTQAAAKSMKKYTCPVCMALKGNVEPLDAALVKVGSPLCLHCWVLMCVYRVCSSCL